MNIVIIVTLSHSVNHPKSKNMYGTSVPFKSSGAVRCQNYVPIKNT